MNMSELWVITYSIPPVNIADPVRPVSEAAVKFKLVLHTPTKKRGQIPRSFRKYGSPMFWGVLRLK
jgi:DNA mismatch repair protein MutH